MGVEAGNDTLICDSIELFQMSALFFFFYFLKGGIDFICVKQLWHLVVSDHNGNTVCFERINYVIGTFLIEGYYNHR